MKKMSGWEGLEASCPNISGAQGAFYWLHEVHAAVSPTAEEHARRSDSQCPPSGLPNPFKPELQSQEQRDFQGDEIISCVWPE